MHLLQEHNCAVHVCDCFRMSYQRRSQRGDWRVDDMEAAIKEVSSKQLSVRQAAQAYNVPKSTLARRSAGKNKVATGAKKHFGRYLPDFPPDYEAELGEYILEMESRFFGLTCMDVRRLAFEFAEMNGLAHRFNKEKKLAGKKWLKGFLSRNGRISLRKPEPTSIARAIGFNKPAVHKFFELYKQIIAENNLPPSRIFNCDETGMSTVHKPSKVLGSKGKHQIGALTSAERGRNVTVVCCMSATGQFVPPAFLYPRKRMKAELMDAAPTESIAFCEGSGWMNGHIFRQYLEHVRKHTSASVINKMLLVLDGHSSHTKNIDVLDFATANGIVMLSLPPHTTHKMQPMDVTFYKPFQTYYDQYVERWMSSHPGRPFTEFQIAGAVAEAFGRAASVKTAVSGFDSCGLWPVNENRWDEHEFAAAQTTDRPLSSNGNMPAATCSGQYTC